MRAGPTVEWFTLQACRPQLPFNGPGGETSLFLAFSRAQPHRGEPAERFAGIRGTAAGDALILQQYYHREYRGWYGFSPELRVPGGVADVAFDSRRQLLAVLLDGHVEVHGMREAADVLLWTRASAGTRLCWAADSLLVLSGACLSVFSPQGSLLHEQAVEATSMFCAEHELVLSTGSGLLALPFLRALPAAGAAWPLHYAAAGQLVLFRPGLLADPSPGAKWEVLGVPAGRTAVLGPWVAVLGREALWLWDRTAAAGSGAAQAHPTRAQPVEGAVRLASGLCVLLTGGGAGSLRVVEPGEPLAALSTVELDRRAVYFGAASSGRHVIVLFDDLTVSVYQVDRLPPGRAAVQFVLSLALGPVPAGRARRTTLTHWQVDLFSRQALSSPSEGDVHMEPVPVALENLVFLQGDSLFAVAVRPSSLAASATAVALEASGVERFLLWAVFDDLWLVSLHAGCARLRRWPFTAAADLEVPLAFVPGAFYPGLADGLLLGAQAGGSHLHVAGSRLLWPQLARFYLEQGETARLRAVFEHSSDTAVLTEYLLAELVRAAAGALRALHAQAAQLVGAAVYRRCLVNVARKVDVAEARWLFQQTVGIEGLYAECLRDGDLGLACNALLLRLVLCDEGHLAAVADLVGRVLGAELFALLGSIRHLLPSIGTPGAAEAADGAVRAAAREMVRLHRWAAFHQLSLVWDAADPAALFDDVFGKLPRDALDALLCGAPLEARVAAIYAQLDMAVPAFSRTTQPPSPSLCTVGGASAGKHPHSPPGTPEATIRFMESIDGLQEEALLWRIALFADAAAIAGLKGANPGLLMSLKVLLGTQPHAGLLFLSAQIRL